MKPYEALYGRKCRSLLYWDEVGDRKILGPEYLREVREQVLLIKEWIQVAQSRQKSHADGIMTPM